MIAQFSLDHKKRTPPHSRSGELSGETRADGSIRVPSVGMPPPRSPSARSLSARIFPNGEFGIGYLPREKKAIAERRYDSNNVLGYQVESLPRKHILEDGTELLDSTDRVLIPVPPRLDPVHELSQRDIKSYGVNGITPYGKKCVRNIAYMMEKRMSRGRVSMGTLTIPALTETEMLVICSNWAYLQKRFFEECKRRYARFGKRFRYVSVTEVQPKRWADKRQVGLHIHFLFPTYKVGGKRFWALPDNWVRETWRRQIYNLLVRYFGDGTYQRMIPTPIYDRQTVKKSAAAYMGKYMSKGADICAEIVEEKGASYLPKQWWSCDSQSRKDLKEAMIVSRGATAEMLLQICNAEMAEYYTYMSPVYVPGRIYEELHIGYCGRLNELGTSVIREFHKTQIRPPDRD